MKILLICLLLIQVCHAQNIETYLANNKAIVQLNENEQFNILSDDFAKKELILFGENHGSDQPHDVDYLLFKSLNNIHDVRHYIAEVDPIKAWMLNCYLKDGNEDWLKKVFSSWQDNGLQWANTSNYNKYKKLHQLYTSLPKNKKFTIIGIDVIQDYSLISAFLRHVTNNKPSNISLINDLLNAVDTIINTDKKKIGEIARAITQNMKANKTYKNILKKDYTTFELFVKNAGYINNNMYRDSIMYRSYTDAVSALSIKGKKVYGFLGFYHTLQVSYGKSFPFASHIKNNSGKVMSIQMLALDCKVLLPYDNSIKKVMPEVYVETLRKQNPNFPKTEKYIPYDLSNDNTMMKSDGIDELKKQTSPNSITLFKLDAANSPYTSGKKLAEITGFQTLKMTDNNPSTIDAFQYVILFRNSSYGFPLLK